MANHSVIQRINIMVAWKASVSARLLASAIKLQHTEMASAGARSVMNLCIYLVIYVSCYNYVYILVCTRAF